MKKSQSKTADTGLTITSLDQLQGIIDRAVPCEFEVDGQLITLMVKRSTEDILEQRRDILRGPQPPYIEGRKDYNHVDPKYLAARDLSEQKARSLVVYTCCPAVAAKQPGLTGVDSIHAFVKSILTENIKSLIELTAMFGGVSREVKARANFISTPASES